MARFVISVLRAQISYAVLTIQARQL